MASSHLTNLFKKVQDLDSVLQDIDKIIGVPLGSKGVGFEFLKRSSVVPSARVNHSIALHSRNILLD